VTPVPGEQVAHDQGVLDTNAVVYLPSMSDTTRLPAHPLITTITLAELSVGPLVAKDDIQQAARQAVLQEAEASFEPLPFDAAAARTFGRVAASLRRAGREPTARSFDAMIAAVAISKGFPLYSANIDDFTGIDGLELVEIPVAAKA
jgi:hypothetical protein